MLYERPMVVIAEPQTLCRELDFFLKADKMRPGLLDGCAVDLCTERGPRGQIRLESRSGARAHGASKTWKVAEEKV